MAKPGVKPGTKRGKYNTPHIEVDKTSKPFVRMARTTLLRYYRREMKNEDRTQESRDKMAQMLAKVLATTERAVNARKRMAYIRIRTKDARERRNNMLKREKMHAGPSGKKHQKRVGSAETAKSGSWNNLLPKAEVIPIKRQ